MSNERKAGPASSLKDIVELLDGARGLDKAATDRLRTFLGFPRSEFAELPDDVSLVRLRGIEELAKLLHHRGGAEQQQPSDQGVAKQHLGFAHREAMGIVLFGRRG